MFENTRLCSRWHFFQITEIVQEFLLMLHLFLFSVLFAIYLKLIFTIYEKF